MAAENEAADLSPQDVADLKRLVGKMRARRQRAGKSGARVTRTNMNRRERQERGAANDLRSALWAYARAEEAYEHAKEQFLIAGESLDKAKARARGLGLLDEDDED